MNCLLVSGGSVQDDFLRERMDCGCYDQVIVADKGMEACKRLGISVDAIVGDFDSVAREALSYYEKQGIYVKRLIPEKDDSDTQSAFHLALERGATQITLVGGTGTRLDHVYANLQLLAEARDLGIDMCMCDKWTCTTVKNQGFTLKKVDQFGDYISFFSLGDAVTDLTLRGFKYPLTNHLLTNRDSGLGVSNEIQDEEATVTFTSGTLAMIQSRDR